MSIVIKNRNEIVEKLAEMLYQFEVEHTGYQEDVYLYIDKDGNATLDTFVNVGGNSWKMMITTQYTENLNGAMEKSVLMKCSVI